MKSVVIGLGIQGNKRAFTAGKNLVACIDPLNPKAEYKDIREVPLSSFDQAFVCTPDTAKYEIIKFLLENKKHVLVEKPFLDQPAFDLSKLKELAQKHKVACYTAYNHRFEPHIASIQSLVQSKELGRIYCAKFFYGNGTARDVRNSLWRDQGMGVLQDLGSHLLDLATFLFGEKAILPKEEFKPWGFHCFENKSFDHIIFSNTPKKESDFRLQFEATLLSWKNTFRIDIFAENGSVHLDGLCKWGPSTLEYRKRILPSGRPDQSTQTLVNSDPTWQLEYEYFTKLCRTGGNNLQNDIWISSVLEYLNKSARDEEK